MIDFGSIIVVSSLHNTCFRVSALSWILPFLSSSLSQFQLTFLKWLISSYFSYSLILSSLCIFKSGLLHVDFVIVHKLICKVVKSLHVTFNLKEKAHVFAFGILSASHASARIPYLSWLANKEQRFNTWLIDGSESQPVSSGKVGLSSEWNETKSLKAMIKILAFILRITGSYTEF